METRNGADSRTGYEAGTQPPAAGNASVVEDFIDIFHAPSAVFARRTSSGFGIQLLIVSVLSALFAFANRGVMAQIMDAEFSRRAAAMMAKNPQLTAEQMATGRGIQESIGLFFGYVGTPVIILFIALFVWIIARLFSAKISYKQAALITTLAWIPRLVGMLAATVQVALTDTSNVNSFHSLSLSPARFMDADAANPKLYALAGNFDVFAIWCFVLIGIGIAVMGRVNRGRALLAAALLFVLLSIPSLFS